MPINRPDLLARVFKLKLKELLEDITVHHVLGKVVAKIHVIEFQKRGLPHCHLLIHLHPDDKLRNSEDIDHINSAEIPDQNANHKLYDIVQSCMIHGSCGYLRPGSVCMEDNTCTKGYPKEFCEHTIESVDGYPKYQRRDNGRSLNVMNVTVDNRWVVPYNPWLLLKYGAHINLEACMSIKSVKYLYKYVYKGHDCIQLEFEEKFNHDEIHTFVDARYISAPEAAWRLFEFPMHQQSHTIVRLAVHLPDEQSVYFHRGEEEHALLNTSHNDTHLTAWFKLNQVDSDANSLLYTEIPSHYIFDCKSRKWKKHQRGGDKVISRIYAVSPNETERYYLRNVLLHTPGANSYADLLKVGDRKCNSFKETCHCLGLLKDDAQWHNTLAEAATFQMPYQLRRMLAMILTHGDPAEPLQLWEDHKADIIEDYLRRLSFNDAVQCGLRDLNSLLIQTGKSLIDCGIPLPVEHECDAQPDYDLNQVAIWRSQLNVLQRDLANAVLDSVMSPNEFNPTLFYLDGPGGSGKTFTYNYLVAELHSRGYKVATATWTGIAATLLIGGRTVHSLFKLPVPLLDTSSCNISPTSNYAAMLREVSLFVVDESSMVPVYAFDAIDRLLRDITGNSKAFGGKVFLWGGDFRQVLPVVRHGHPSAIVENCIKNSTLWPCVAKYQLTTNMRVHQDEAEFCEWLLNLGDGKLPIRDSSPFNGCIQIPGHCVTDSVVKSVFGDELIHDRVILCPTNDESLKLNETILNLLPGQPFMYFSYDDIVSDDDNERAQYPIEFLNSLTPSGIPPHRLTLKVGAVVILLHNMNVHEGLCNGTRLQVCHMHDHSIDAEVLTGMKVGYRVLIPRIQLAPSDSGMPFVLSRCQFPLRLAYSMTINKAQGQTFAKVGLHMERPCFAHGQLYVALSRARRFADVKVEILGSTRQGTHNGDTFTANVVYRQILN
ncbi:uncharacterized protein [Dysidea avara]|uniref:uncharacterized protein n=1 Tax=Dysidea avara TaxID=196820 RepID=UPI003319B8E7